MTVTVIIKARDETNGAIKSAIGGFTKLGSVGATAFKVVGAAIAGATAATGLFAYGLVQAGGELQAMQGKFDTVFKQFGAQVQQNLGDFAQVAGRSKVELMGMAASAQDLFVPLGFARDEASVLSEVLVKASVHLGSFADMADNDAFERLRGTLIGNHENALAFGVVINENTLKQEMARMGADKLSGSEAELAKVQARLNLLLKGSSDALGDKTGALAASEDASIAMSDELQNLVNNYGDAIATSHEFNNTTRAVGGAIKDTMSEMGLILIPVATDILNAFRTILPGLQNIAGGFVIIFKSIINLIKVFGKSLLTAMGVNFETLSKDSGAWGMKFVFTLAQGMASAISAVVRVLQRIGEVIRSWLQPHSPPKIAPDLDKWGAGAMTEYMDGWAEGDFTVFNEISSTIKGHLESMFQGESAGKEIAAVMLQVRDATAQVMTAYQEFDDEQLTVMDSNNTLLQNSVLGTLEWKNVVDNAVDEISEAAGGLPQAYEDYLSVLFEAEGASRMVAQAQQELNDLNEKFAAQLSPLNKELQGIQDQKDAIKDQEKMASLQETLNDETASAQDKEMARLELAEMQIKNKIKAVQREQDAETEKAQKKLTAAQQLEADLKKELSRRKAILDVNKENLDLMTQMKEAIDDMADAVKDKVGSGIADALKDADLGTMEPPSFEGGFDGMFGDMAKVIELSFEPLEDQFADLGETWGGVFTDIANMDFSAISDAASSFTNLYNIVTEFLSNNSESILTWVTSIGVGFGAWVVLTNVIPLIASVVGWFVTAGSVGGVIMTVFGGIVGVLGGPLLAVLALVAGAIALFAYAWQNNTHGIRDAFAKLWEALSPIFNSIVSWFTGDGAEATWTWGEVFSAVGAVLGFVFEAIVAHIVTLVTRMTWGVGIMSTGWTNFKALVEMVATIIQLKWMNLQTFFEGFVNWMRDKLVQLGLFFSNVAQTIVDKWQVIAEKFIWFKESVFQPMIDGIVGGIQNLIYWVNQMIEKLSELSVPELFTPGSPTPFEMGLRGISEAMNDISANSAPTLNNEMNRLGDSGAGALEQNNNNVNNFNLTYYNSANRGNNLVTDFELMKSMRKGI